MSDRTRARTYFVFVVTVAIALLATVTTAHAQATDPSGVSLQVDHFEPLPNQNHSIWNVLTSDTLGHLNWTAGSVFHYAEGLMLIDAPDGSTVRVIDSVFKAEPWFAIGILEVAELGIVIPVALTQSGDDLALLNRAGEQVEGVGLGDVRLVLKAKLLDPEDAYGIGVGFAAPISFPTGSETTYNSESDLRFEPKLAIDWRHDDIGLLIVANVGLYLRETAALLDYTRGSEFRWAFGVAAPVGVDDLNIVADVFGAVGLEDNADPDNTSISAPMEALGGLRYNAGYGVHMSLGGGAGISDGVGAPEFRILGGLGYAALSFDTDDDGIEDELDACLEEKEDIDGFEDGDGCPDNDNDADGIADAEDSCPDEAEDGDGFEDGDGCIDDDNDGDGIADAVDQCRDEAEDPDGFEDEDGCPEDNDGDGIADAADQCIDQAEDADGFEDEDGCPDDDNDGDLVPDATDKCRDIAEDPDGFEDGDGCPDLDNDNDGFPDVADSCPDEAEVINGVDDTDGCPDEGKTLIIVKAEKIEILDKVFFATNKSDIKKKSFPVLDQVATALNNNQRIKKVRVSGHTDNKGKPDKNLTLSEERAKAVVEYLVSKGVDGSRLEAEGLGDTKPLVPHDDKGAAKQNRRVEFEIVEVEK